MKVTILPDVLEYLEEIVFILFEKQYFSDLKSSMRYVDDLIDDIKDTLPRKMHKSAPSYFNRYGEGMYYAAFKKSKRTSWYAFFRIYEVNGERIYQVRYIANNHTVAQYL